MNKTRWMIVALVLIQLLCSCEKEQLYKYSVADGSDAVALLNESIGGLNHLAQYYLEGDKVVTYTNTQTKDAICVDFMTGRQLTFPKLSKYADISFPSVSIIWIDSSFFWTLNGEIILDQDNKPYKVGPRDITPIIEYNEGRWLCRMGLTKIITCEVLEPFEPLIIEDHEDDGFVVFVLPTGCQIVFPISDSSSWTHPMMLNNAYYKDIFLDAGIGLTSRKQLFAVTYLGKSLECMSFSSDDYTNLQNQLIEGDSTDMNGRLLYPDGQPRYQLLFVNGGQSNIHGQSLTESAKENMRKFVQGGGSYIGTCAGAFLASIGDKYPTTNPNYLHIWPGFVERTHIRNTYSGFRIESNCPLLNYYDFGGDYYIDSVRHNGGCYVNNLPMGTEVLARYDFPDYDFIHLQPSAWAYKCSNNTGRIIQIGSHPEEVRMGERRDFTAAAILYAIDGRGTTRLKGILQNGIMRNMVKSTDENEPEFTMIGDLQCHHFVTFIPEDAIDVTFTLQSDADADLSLMLSNESYAYEENAQYVSNQSGGNQTLVFPSISSGVWYVTVKCNTTVDIVETEWGQSYTGRVDVLNGVPYRIKVNWSNPCTKIK